MSKIFLFQAIQFSQTIQFSIIMPLVLFNPEIGGAIRCYRSEPNWTREQWQWRGALHSPKPQQYRNLTIRLFSVISVFDSLSPPLSLIHIHAHTHTHVFIQQRYCLSLVDNISSYMGDHLFTTSSVIKLKPVNQTK